MGDLHPMDLFGIPQLTNRSFNQPVAGLEIIIYYFGKGHKRSYLMNHNSQFIASALWPTSLALKQIYHPINKAVLDEKGIKMHELCRTTEGNINRAVKRQDINLSCTSLTLICIHVYTLENHLCDLCLTMIIWQ